MKLLLYQVVIFFLLFNGFASNKVLDSLIQDSCKEASRINEPHFYKLCITSLKENPESQKVRNIDDLIVVAVKNAMRNMTNMKGIVEKILKERKYKNRLSEKLMHDCLKRYLEGNNLLTKCIEYIKLRDYDSARDSTRDAGIVPSCEMKFNGDNNQTSPVTKENDVLFEMTDIPFTFIGDAHIHPKYNL